VLCEGVSAAGSAESIAARSSMVFVRVAQRAAQFTAPSTPSNDKRGPRLAGDSHSTSAIRRSRAVDAYQPKGCPIGAGATALPATNRLPTAAGARHTFIDGSIHRRRPARRRRLRESFVMSRQVHARVRRDQRNKVRGQGRAGRS
jgi:hypothetical protein